MGMEREMEMDKEKEMETDPDLNPNPSPSPSPDNSTKACADCHTTKTPLWRGGPEGPKVWIGLDWIHHHQPYISTCL